MCRDNPVPQVQFGGLSPAIGTTLAIISNRWCEKEPE
jgi:hypothetical protein